MKSGWDAVTIVLVAVLMILVAPSTPSGSAQDITPTEAASPLELLPIQAQPSAMPLKQEAPSGQAGKNDAAVTWQDDFMLVVVGFVLTFVPLCLVYFKPRIFAGGPHSGPVVLPQGKAGLKRVKRATRCSRWKV